VRARGAGARDPVCTRVARQQAAEAGGATGDQHGARAVHLARQGQDDFSDVSRLRHETKRVGGLAHVPCTMGKRQSCSASKQPHDFAKHRPDVLCGQVEQVEGGVRDAG